MWARRFVNYCESRGVDPIAHLTERNAETFRAEGCPRRKFRRRRRLRPIGRIAIVAPRALSCALASLGYPVPEWSEPPPVRPVPSKLVREFVAYRVRHHGIASSTIRADVDVATMFLRFLHASGRKLAGIRVADLDGFVLELAAKCTKKTVAGNCSTLRAFLRFLHMTGRVRADLAACVVAPRIRSVDRPPRALPWEDVKRILKAIDVQRPLGRRDFAMLLTMATYGMGAGEVLSLRLHDIDWQARNIRVRRPKTGTDIALPLLDSVARALADYARRGRPVHAAAREIFVSHRMPHRRLSGAAAIRHRLVEYAAAAGVKPAFIGSHVLRHSHACRQIEEGAPPKIVSDILGHRRPSSTSAYVRVATEGLRCIALPVPT